MPLPQAWGWLLLAPRCPSTAQPVQTKPREDTRAQLCQEGPVLSPARKRITTTIPASREESQGNHNDPGPSKLAAAGWEGQKHKAGPLEQQRKEGLTLLTETPQDQENIPVP